VVSYINLAMTLEQPSCSIRCNL